MPLILMTGYPSSGKSKWANKIKEQMQSKIEKEGKEMRIVVHSDDSLGISRSQYADSEGERKARAAQMSAVKRDLGKKTLVILDSCCYNKGMRYQLFCESKGLSTGYAVVQVMAPVSQCLAQNEDRWEENLLKQMVQRYEEPDGSKRWDAPLFNVAFDDEEMAWDEIWLSISSTKVKPNASVVTRSAPAATSLHQLDSMTNQVTSKMTQSLEIGATTVQLGGGITVELPSGTSVAQLQRLRRRFVALHNNTGVAVAPERVVALFAQFVQNDLSE
ncbi:Kti12 protein [Martiniozyma asiatica (nom. inval.)]|nr:Kti12 protein [Martiniozyma asiatica]